MKKLLLFILLGNSLHAFSQTYHPGRFNQQIDLTGAAGMLSLVADKYLMELSETNMFTLRINWVNQGDDGVVPQQYDYNFEDPARAPWKITKWEIIEGGGELKEGPGHYYASYVAPSVMPANRSVTIAITLDPQQPGYPKTQLLQTVYIEDNSNVFYYDCPAYGVHEEKYVIKSDSGLLQKPNTTQASSHANTQQQNQLQDLQRRLDEVNAQAKQQVASKGFDLASLTSNTKAIYASEKDITTIQIRGKDVEMVHGQRSVLKRDYFITLTFPGQSTGTFKIKSKAEITATIFLMDQQLGCTCAYDPQNPQGESPPCAGGVIYIKKYDNRPGGFIEGTVFANIQGGIGSSTIFGNLEGKFKVKVANIQ